jgi:predicted esterase
VRFVAIPFLTTISLLLMATGVAKSPAQNASETPRPAPGTVISKQITQNDATQSYALYLPSRYTPEKRWPIVYVFDPFARGKVAVELMKDGAERYGYIVAGSNNSKNGPWKEEFEAANAMFQDTHARFSIDNRLIYFAGLSGGARVASQLALLCKCAAGVFLNGAGFPMGTTPPRDISFAVFSTAGTVDFNYPEVVRLQESLESASYPHWLRIYEGPHQWAPEEVAREALAWFRMVAMEKGTVARDETFLGAQAAQEKERAGALERDGGLFGAWREYSQARATFGKLHLGEFFSQEADRLAKEKEVREGAKREKADFDEQERLSGEISQGFAAIARGTDYSPDLPDQIRGQIRSLRERTEHEKRTERQRVDERALTGVFVEAMEAGSSQQDAKEYGRAASFYELAAEARPDSMWALPNLAVARALGGDRKGALAALRKARQAAKDQSAFVDWLKKEEAFAKLRETPEFAALLGAQAQQP